MYKEITGDLLAVENIDIICHQVNYKGVMGAGIAKQIADKYPFVKDVYEKRCSYNTSQFLLGTIDVLPISGDPDNTEKWVCNMYAQDKYGRDKQYTDYNAFGSCLYALKEYIRYNPKLTIGFSKYIGCGIAGGDWKEVEPMIRRFSELVENEVYIVEYKG